MDLSFSAEDEQFRQEVRGWIQEAMPAHLKEKAANGAHYTNEETIEWHKILAEKGWAAPNWP